MQFKEWAAFDFDKTTRKLKTISLGMLMLGYVVLVTYALAPLGCQDLYGKRFMTTHASIEVRLYSSACAAPPSA